MKQFPKHFHLYTFPCLIFWTLVVACKIFSNHHFIFHGTPPWYVTWMHKKCKKLNETARISLGQQIHWNRLMRVHERHCKQNSRNLSGLTKKNE